MIEFVQARITSTTMISPSGISHRLASGSNVPFSMVTIPSNPNHRKINNVQRFIFSPLRGCFDRYLRLLFATIQDSIQSWDSSVHWFPFVMIDGAHSIIPVTAICFGWIVFHILILDAAQSGVVFIP